MKKLIFLILAIALLAVIQLAPAQTFSINPYMRVIPITLDIDTVITANDSTNVFYLPFKAEILQIQAIASTVTDTVDIVLGQTNPTTKVNSTSTATARLLTANTVAYGNPTTRTNATAGTYWRAIAKVGTDAGNIAYDVKVIVWLLLN